MVIVDTMVVNSDHIAAVIEPSGPSNFSPNAAASSTSHKSHIAVSSPPAASPSRALPSVAISLDLTLLPGSDKRKQVPLLRKFHLHRMKINKKVTCQPTLRVFAAPYPKYTKNKAILYASCAINILGI